MYLGHYFIGIFLLTAVTHAWYNPLADIVSTSPREDWSFFSSASTIRVDLDGAYFTRSGNMLSEPTVQSYSFNQIDELPTNIYCLELDMTSEQLMQLTSAQRRISSGTRANWRKVLDHISSVQCILIRFVPPELITLLDAFAKKMANGVTKLIFNQYDGTYSEWHCSLCETFPNVYTMHFESTDMSHLNFEACRGKEMKYSADKYSIDKARKIEQAMSG